VAKDEIRVHYSGLIIFAAQMLSVVTGMAFTLLFTRNMTSPQYGVWNNIYDVTGYFMLFSGLVPFWATRFVARGNQGATKTALLTNLVVGLPSASIYFLLVPMIIVQLNISETYVMIYLIASVLIINTHLIATLEACLRAERPQIIGFGLVIEETSKLALAYVLIVGLRQLFLGGMLSIIVSAGLQILYYLKVVGIEFKQKIQFGYVREWLKGSTASIYNAVGTQIAGFIFILLIIYGGKVARADYQAATIFANIISYSSFLAFALYPKLLARNSVQEVTATMRTVLMFALPLATIAISLAPSLLTVLNVAYSAVWPILILLAIDAIIGVITQFYTSVILGVEKLDEAAKIPLKKLIKSRMFKLFTLPYVQAAINLPLTFYVLTGFAQNHPLRAAFYVTAINMAAHIIIFSLTYAMAQASAKTFVPWRNIAKYLAACAVTAAALYLLPHPTTLALTVATVLTGVFIYAVLVLAIDKPARALVTAIFREIAGTSSV
jgi:O-antigen/teichoic acid export membrane protein